MSTWSTFVCPFDLSSTLNLRLCYCNLKSGDNMESRKACSDAININDEPRLYCDRAEAYLAEDMFDEVEINN